MDPRENKAEALSILRTTVGQGTEYGRALGFELSRKITPEEFTSFHINLVGHTHDGATFEVQFAKALDGDFIAIKPVHIDPNITYSFSASVPDSSGAMLGMAHASDSFTIIEHPSHGGGGHGGGHEEIIPLTEELSGMKTDQKFHDLHEEAIKHVQEQINADPALQKKYAGVSLSADYVAGPADPYADHQLYSQLGDEKYAQYLEQERIRDELRQRVKERQIALFKQKHTQEFEEHFKNELENTYNGAWHDDPIVKSAQREIERRYQAHKQYLESLSMYQNGQHADELRLKLIQARNDIERQTWGYFYSKYPQKSKAYAASHAGIQAAKERDEARLGSRITKAFSSENPTTLVKAIKTTAKVAAIASPITPIAIGATKAAQTVAPGVRKVATGATSVGKTTLWATPIAPAMFLAKKFKGKFPSIHINPKVTNTAKNMGKILQFTTPLGVGAKIAPKVVKKIPTQTSNANVTQKGKKAANIVSFASPARLIPPIAKRLPTPSLSPQAKQQAAATGKSLGNTAINMTPVGALRKLPYFKRFTSPSNTQSSPGPVSNAINGINNLAGGGMPHPLRGAENKIKSKLQNAAKNLGKKIGKEALKKVTMLPPVRLAIIITLAILVLCSAIIVMWFSHSNTTLADETTVTASSSGPTQQNGCLTLSVDGSPASVPLDGKPHDLTFSITVTYTCAGSVDITITDQIPFPNSLKFNKDKSDGGKDDNGTVTWNLTGVTKDSPQTVKLALHLLAHPPDKDKINQIDDSATATITSGGDNGNGSSTSTIYVPPSTKDCAGKYASDLQKFIKSGQPTWSKNFGDPNCDFNLSDLHKLLRQLDPKNADKWYYIIVLGQNDAKDNLQGNGNGECSGDPNAWAPPFGEQASLDKRGGWGCFQMGSSKPPYTQPPAPGQNGEFDRGDVNWQKQADNAVTYNKAQNNDFCYWQTARCAGFASPSCPPVPGSCN